jgi:hypothetical protein
MALNDLTESELAQLCEHSVRSFQSECPMDAKALQALLLEMLAQATTRQEQGYSA